MPGWEVSVERAINVDEALHAARSGGFDVCLCDYYLGSERGTTLIGRLASPPRSVPVLLITSLGAREVDIEAMHEGAMGFLDKNDVTPDLLERSIRYALKMWDERQRLLDAATRDPLTGLWNRTVFRRCLDTALADHSNWVAVLYVDVDRFKTINDTWGHAAGDRVLEEFSRRAEAALPPGTVVARLGGDEFAVLLEHCRTGEVSDAIQALRGAVREPIRVDEKVRVQCSVSVGASVRHHSDHEDGERLMAEADAAMYAAKRRTRHLRCDDADHDAMV